MKETSSLLKIGSILNVDVNKVKDRLPISLNKKLAYNPEGRLIDYKMTDANGIGLILEFNDGSKVWFFENEILSLEKNNTNSSLSKERILNFAPNSDKNSVLQLVNPFNFFEWLIYSLKDVF